MGLANIRKITAFTSSISDFIIQKIYHSGKKRAEQTAFLLAESLKPVDGITETEGLAPGDDPLIWFKKIDKINEDIMLVGHLPHLDKLASMLLCSSGDGQFVSFRKAGIVAFFRDDTGKWVIEWMIIPDIL